VNDARHDYPPALLLSGHATTYERMWDELDQLRADTDRLSNALKWIRQNATLHYMGGAFDPEHMGELANQATAALNGEPVPDYDEAMAAARVKAQEWMVLFSEGQDGQADDVQDVRSEPDGGARTELGQDTPG
jgi:hypothetical protein